MAVSELIRASRRLSRSLSRIPFSLPVAFVYSPLVYAREPAERYLARYADGPRPLVFLGMNPGPWGMGQTGVPFGEIGTVRDWLGVDGRVEEPQGTHPRVPVAGFACSRSEVSGRRLWGLLREYYGSPGRLAGHAFVGNYCPLLFLDAEGRNLTPDRLARADRDVLFPACDELLAETLAVLQPRWAAGVGAFATARLRAVIGARTVPSVIALPHPSPASPAANRGWAGPVRAALEAAGAWKD